MNVAELDGVTIDAYGTLVTLLDPVSTLIAALAERNVHRTREVVLHGFRTEVAHYTEHVARGHDEDGLAHLQRECARVFLEVVEADLDADEFAPVYAAAMHFELLPDVVSSLERLRGLGFELAVVANWDLSLRRLLEEVGVAEHFRTIVHAAAKPATDGLLRALAEMQIEPGRALHIGDDDVDQLAAGAAGMRFAPAPLPDAVATLT